jgi:hypothetical protein
MKDSSLLCWTTGRQYSTYRGKRQGVALAIDKLTRELEDSLSEKLVDSGVSGWFQG